jgi:hypothetical protein
MTPEFDTDAWRKLRDAKFNEWIGDPYAIDFIILMGDVAEVWDDLIDQDKSVKPEDVNRIFSSLLVDLPLNSFFDKNKLMLMPLVITVINAWQDANELEKGSDNDKIVAYTLRDYLFELLFFVIYLTRGNDYLRTVSVEIRKFFTEHETFAQYLRTL